MDVNDVGNGDDIEEDPRPTGYEVLTARASSEKAAVVAAAVATAVIENT